MGFNSGFKGLKCFEIKIILVINSCKKIAYFSFYFNLKIIRFFLPDPVYELPSRLCKEDERIGRKAAVTLIYKQVCLH